MKPSIFLTINENTVDPSITTCIQALILIMNLSQAMPNWVTHLKRM